MPIYRSIHIKMRINLSAIVLLVVSNLASAQRLENLVIEKEPLVLKAAGSFFVGGQPEAQSRSEMGAFFPEGNVSVNQMYVNFMMPAKPRDSTCFVFIHGIALSGKTYETTPDGRMGWNEFFVRRGYSVYVVDQVGIGRSGFNQKQYNRVRNKETDADKQPLIIRISDENVAVNFRIRDSAGNAMAESKFPLKALDEFSRQSIPFTAGTVPAPNPNFSNLANLAAQLKQTVVVSHSQSGSFPIHAALFNPEGIKAIIMVEPGGTGAGFTDEQINKIKNIPVLLVYGDNLDIDTGVPGHSWKSAYEGWNGFIKRLQAVGGIAHTMFLPDLGIKGNSHMLMMDTNNLQIADMILEWLATHKK